MKTIKFAFLSMFYVMETNGYRLLLYLNYFDLVNVQEHTDEVIIYLEEKHVVPEQYSG